MPLTNIQLGQTLALFTALAWGFAVILFKKSGETVHPIALNVFKNFLAVVLLIPTIPLFGETLFYDAPRNNYLLLLASGALGIGISDTLFFMCLNRLGAGLTAIIDCLYSPFIIIMSIIWLGESLTLFQVIGAVMIISAVLTAVNRKGVPGLKRRDLWIGVGYGTLAMATNALGLIMIKRVLEQSPLFWVTEVRIFGGLLVLLLVLLFNPHRNKIIGSLRLTGGWKYTISGSFIGTYIAMVLWLGGMQLERASITAALNQTSSIFVFIFAWLILKEKITIPKIIGIILAVGGVMLITLL